MYIARGLLDHFKVEDAGMWSCSLPPFEWGQTCHVQEGGREEHADVMGLDFYFLSIIPARSSQVSQKQLHPPIVRTHNYAPDRLHYCVGWPSELTHSSLCKHDSLMAAACHRSLYGETCLRALLGEIKMAAVSGRI